MSVVKSGYLRKHSKSILSGGWNRVWVVLYQDTTLVVYKKQGDSSPMGTINLFDVRKWFAYGEHTSSMSERPNLPPGESIKQVLAIPQKPSKKAKIHWFLADNEADLHSWMDAICKVLPPPPQKETPSAPHQPIQQQTAAPVSSAPPPYPGGPATGLGFDGVVASGPPMPSPQHSPYPQHHSPHPQPSASYPQQAPYSQPASYPQQPYYQAPPTTAYAGYPQQQPYYQPPPPQYGPPPPAAYPQQQYHHPQGGYYQQPPTTVVYQQQPKQRGGFLSGNAGNAALGLAGGAVLGYGMSRMMGGGLGGGLFGWGHRGSWSSLSSFGSCGSFGSFGSFD